MFFLILMSDNDSISNQCLASATYNSCRSSNIINDGIITKTFIATIVDWFSVTKILRVIKRFVLFKPKNLVDFERGACKVH